MYRYRFWTEVELLLYQVKAEVGVCSDLVDGAFLLPVPVSPTLASRGSNPPPCIQSSKCCQYNHTDPCAPHLAVFFGRKILSQKIWCYVIGFVRSISLNREKNNLSFLSWCLCCSHSVPVCMSAFTALFQKTHFYPSVHVRVSWVALCWNTQDSELTPNSLDLLLTLF